MTTALRLQFVEHAPQEFRTEGTRLLLKKTIVFPSQ